MKRNSRQPLQVPEQVDEKGILVGWSLEHEYRHPPIGFHYGDDRFTPASGFLNPVLFDGEGHLMTIAPTGSGKGTGCIIPTLLRHPGPVIVIDPKGENAAVTARRRRELGQKVVVLDPLGIGDKEGDHLNPFDLLDRNSATLPDDVAMLLNILLPETVHARDRFWISRAQQLLIGLTLHLIVDYDEKHHNLASLRDLVNQDHQKLAKVAKAMDNSRHPDVRSMASSLKVPAPETFGGILSYAQDAVGFMRGDLVQTATNDSTFSFDEITRGDPLSLFIVIPSDKLESHGSLLKIWIGALIAAITRRQGPPPDPTLFILDEAAQLGPLPQLRQAITLLRGYGLQTWSFWQDVSQLHRLYPADWETMVNNCKVLQAFGANNMNAASAMASLTGFSRPWEILDLDYNEMILLIGGDEAVIAQRPDYLQDPLFRGMHDENPRHDEDREILPSPRKPQRVYSRPPKPLRLSAGDPIHPPAPLWSSWERNEMGEVIGVRRLSGSSLEKKIMRCLKKPRFESWPSPPIIDGDWRGFFDRDAVSSLMGIWPQLVPNFGHGLKGIDAVRRISLSFYPEALLCEGRCHDENGFAGYLTWISAPETAVHLTGTAPPIHQLNSLLDLQLYEIEAATQYLKFFCAAVHAGAGAFRVIESERDLRYPHEEEAGLPEEALHQIHPCRLRRIEPQEEPRDPDSEDAHAGELAAPLWNVTCVVQHGGALFSVEMLIRENGLVEMIEDRLIIEGQDFLIDFFVEGTRTSFAKAE